MTVVNDVDADNTDDETEKPATATEAVDAENEASPPPPEPEPGADGDADADDEGGQDDVAEVEVAEENSLLSDRAKAKRRERSWGAYLRRGVMPVLLVISLAVSGYLGWLQWQTHRVHQAGEQARQAAIAYAGILTSMDSNDPKNLDENFRQVLDGATGKFKDQYTQSSVHLRQLLLDNKATAHGVVVDSAIASQTLNKVVVLLFIDQTVTNTQMPDPRIDRSRIKVTMEKVDGRWRASEVELL